MGIRKLDMPGINIKQAPTRAKTNMAMITNWSIGKDVTGNKDVNDINSSPVKR
ncbi:hypothetical protein [Bartonella sp. WD12.1]|uniref:hypothetical protein n=1 Tax=Bartonella sp. WD12.1 TaxID=1933903 RepID=UPI001F0A3308|nr:hypothetical protein [Bartonella sp. WD12.1]